MKNLITVFCICFSSLLIGQTTDLPFKNGEWLRFKVRYGIFNASMATLSLKEEMYNGEKVYHAIGKGSTTGLARVFFRVDDVYESYFGINDGKPRLFIRNIYEGHYPNIDQLKTGEQVSLDMIFDDDEVYKFKLKLLGREQVKTNFGTVNTLKFCPLVQDGRVFKEEESITMWITDDKNKIPVKLKASLRVGSLIAELDGFNFLKYETNLKK